MSLLNLASREGQEIGYISCMKFPVAKKACTSRIHSSHHLFNCNLVRFYRAHDLDQMIGKRPRSFSVSLQPPPIASKEFKFSAPQSPASSGAATSIARQKLAKALDLISGGDAKDTESVMQLLRDCIDRARIYFDDESKTVISTASTVLARLLEIQHNDQRRSSRKLYESAVHADHGNLDAAYELACILKLDAVGKEDLMYVEELLRLASGVDEKWVGGGAEEDQRRGRASDNEGRRVRHESEWDTDMDEGEARKERVDARREGTMFPESREAFEEEREGLEASNIWGYDSGGAVEASDQGSQPCQRKAKEALALLWMQTGTRSHGADHVLRQLGFTHRLASRVLAYPPPQSLEASDPAPLSPSAGSFLRVYDHVLPPAALLAMQRLFAPSAPFWEEHGYFRRDRGYFSYLLPLSLKSGGDPTSSSSSFPLPPSMAVEAVVRDHLLPLAREAFPHLFSSPACSALSSCSSDLSLTAEWWAHCRRHAEGHQLHFDSLDEGKGFVRHPLVSCVLYLAEADGVGGPTLVTDQVCRLQEGRAARVTRGE